MEGHRTSGRSPFLRRQPVLPHASPAPHCARSLSRVARLRASVLALSGDEAQLARLLRARAAPRRAQSMHVLWKGTARAGGRRSFGARPCSHMPVLPLTARGRLRVYRACAPLRWLSMGTRPSTRACCARAPRRAGNTCSLHFRRALHERENAVPSVPAHAPTCHPCPSLREVACA